LNISEIILEKREFTSLILNIFYLNTSIN